MWIDYKTLNKIRADSDYVIMMNIAEIRSIVENNGMKRENVVMSSDEWGEEW